jgi:hypothetical protein
MLRHSSGKMKYYCRGSERAHEGVYSRSGDCHNDNNAESPGGMESNSPYTSAFDHLTAVVEKYYQVI